MVVNDDRLSWVYIYSLSLFSALNSFLARKKNWNGIFEVAYSDGHNLEELARGPLSIGRCQNMTKLPLFAV